MGKVIYVGNLDGEVKTDPLRTLFSQHGFVENAEAVKKKSTGKCRGFGFVIMKSSEEAQAAIDSLNETELLGNTITVAEAKPPRQRGGSDFGDDRRGGFRGDRGGREGGFRRDGGHRSEGYRGGNRGGGGCGYRDEH